MFLAAITLAMSPAAATAPAYTHIYRSHDVATAIKAGCKVQYVHRTGGKIGPEVPAILRCPGKVEALESRRGNR
jgi:hypothetical protein